MAKIVHLKGASMFFQRAKNPQYDDKYLNATKCGYWLTKPKNEVEKMTYNEEEVTCKLCIKLIKNQ